MTSCEAPDMGLVANLSPEDGLHHAELQSQPPLAHTRSPSCRGTAIAIAMPYGRRRRSEWQPICL
jgi:hypothetical protein